MDHENKPPLANPEQSKPDDTEVPRPPLDGEGNEVPLSATDEAVASPEAAPIPEDLKQEYQLAKKLINPELKGMRGLKDTINQKAVATINAVESVVHKTQDVYALTKNKMLTSRQHKAQRKYDRFDRKAQTSYLAFRRKKFQQKATDQKKVLDTRTSNLSSHNAAVETRAKRREAASTGREEAYNKRRTELLDKARTAQTRKIERRARNLKLREYWANDPAMKEELQKRRSVLTNAIIFTRLKQPH